MPRAGQIQRLRLRLATSASLALLAALLLCCPSPAAAQEGWRVDSPVAYETGGALGTPLAAASVGGEHIVAFAGSDELLRLGAAASPATVLTAHELEEEALGLAVLDGALYVSTDDRRVYRLTNATAGGPFSETEAVRYHGSLSAAGSTLYGLRKKKLARLDVAGGGDEDTVATLASNQHLLAAGPGMLVVASDSGCLSVLSPAGALLSTATVCPSLAGGPASPGVQSMAVFSGRLVVALAGRADVLLVYGLPGLGLEDTVATSGIGASTAGVLFHTSPDGGLAYLVPDGEAAHLFPVRAASAPDPAAGQTRSLLFLLDQPFSSVIGEGGVPVDDAVLSAMVRQVEEQVAALHPAAVVLQTFVSPTSDGLILLTVRAAGVVGAAQPFCITHQGAELCAEPTSEALLAARDANGSGSKGSGDVVVLAVAGALLALLVIGALIIGAVLVSRRRARSKSLDRSRYAGSPAPKGQLEWDNDIEFAAESSLGEAPPRIPGRDFGRDCDLAGALPPSPGSRLQGKSPSVSEFASKGYSPCGYTGMSAADVLASMAAAPPSRPPRPSTTNALAKVLSQSLAVNQAQPSATGTLPLGHVYETMNDRWNKHAADLTWTREPTPVLPPAPGSSSAETEPSAYEIPVALAAGAGAPSYEIPVACSASVEPREYEQMDLPYVKPSAGAPRRKQSRLPEELQAQDAGWYHVDDKSDAGASGSSGASSSAGKPAVYDNCLSDSTEAPTLDGTVRYDNVPVRTPPPARGPATQDGEVTYDVASPTSPTAAPTGAPLYTGGPPQQPAGVARPYNVIKITKRSGSDARRSSTGTVSSTQSKVYVAPMVKRPGIGSLYSVPPGMRGEGVISTPTFVEPSGALNTDA